MTQDRAAGNSPRSARAWEIVEAEGRPSDLVGDTEVPSSGSRTAVFRWPTTAAVVLGSTQRPADFDAGRCRAAGVDIVQRRSGGGAVLVRPGAQIWLDLYVARDDPLFQEDVTLSFQFVGEIWRESLRAAIDGTKATDLTGRVSPAGPRSGGRPGRLGLSERDSGQAAARWSRLLCFGALGASEVTLAGRKLVGISERRDRAGAWFFSVALLEVQGRDLAELLAEADLRDPAKRRLEECSTAVPGGPASRDELVAALKLRLATGADPPPG